MKRNRLLLYILLGILGLSLAYCYWAFPRQQRISPQQGHSAAGRQGTGKVPARRSVTPVKDTRLHLELLKVNGGAFPGYKRNIFGSVQPPPPPPPKAVPPPAAGTVVPPPPGPTPVQEALAQFSFLGYLEKDGRKTVFLSRGHTLYLVNQGTRFGDQQEFTVTELTPERLVIQSAKDDRQIVVPLVENQPLIPLFHPGGGGSRGRSSAARFPSGRFVAPPAPVVPPPAEVEPPQEHDNPAVAPPREHENPAAAPSTIFAPFSAPGGLTPTSPAGAPADANEVGK
jgi:hypothetical protein